MVAKTVMKKPAGKRAAVAKRPAAAKKQKPTAVKKRPAATARAAKKVRIPEELQGMTAFVVNLERRPDRWERVRKMLKKEAPWLIVEQFPASDGTKNPIPEDEVSVTWNTKYNGHYADYYEWVFDAPGTEMDGQVWKWAADADDDEEWKFVEHGEDPFMYIRDAPSFAESPVRTGTVEKVATGEKFKLKLRFADRFINPGEQQNMSGGERGCAHSHFRLWKLAAERQEPTLVLEDDVHLTFQRSNPKLGKANGEVFRKRLGHAMQHTPGDFDVIYLGWSGWRGGHQKMWKGGPEEAPISRKYIRKAEYVWTTVAYVISPAGAKKLLAAAGPVNQPVDNFMAWEASQRRLNAYVVLDEGDNDDTWAGGIVDQFDFQGDSDIKKSDGGVQGDDAKDFAAGSAVDTAVDTGAAAAAENAAGGTADTSMQVEATA